MFRFFKKLFFGNYVSKIQDTIIMAGMIKAKNPKIENEMKELILKISELY